MRVPSLLSSHSIREYQTLRALQVEEQMILSLVVAIGLFLGLFGMILGVRAFAASVIRKREPEVWTLHHDGVIVGECEREVDIWGLLWTYPPAQLKGGMVEMHRIGNTREYSMWVNVPKEQLERRSDERYTGC
jgi:hypothetical protein